MSKSMKQIREEIRLEYAKQYKEKIHELVNDNATLRRRYVELTDENQKLKEENMRLRRELSTSTPTDALARNLLQFATSVGGTNVRF